MGGIRGNLEEVPEFIHSSRLLFLVPRETWLRPMDSLKHPVIVIDHRHPREEFSKGRVIRGFMILRTLQLTESSDFAELFRDEASHTCGWFRSRTWW